jgi:hypothetical protein
MRISVIVTEAEHAKIKKAAGLIPLSAFLKAAVLAQLPRDREQDNQKRKR